MPIFWLAGLHDEVRGKAYDIVGIFEEYIILFYLVELYWEFNPNVQFSEFLQAGLVSWYLREIIILDHIILLWLQSVFYIIYEKNMVLGMIVGSYSY